jgi:hypothetical protein
LRTASKTGVEEWIPSARELLRRTSDVVDADRNLVSSFRRSWHHCGSVDTADAGRLGDVWDALPLLCPKANDPNLE